MAESLGQKLRKAREERDISISEVAEQTRISALYLEAIEKDEYKILPGGIFNKGFIKSFAKYVGIDEHEALQDYARIMDAQANEDPDPSDARSYRPEVLTDDSGSGSMLPTIIFAVIILGLMAWGILALVNYVQSTESSSSDIASLENNNIKTEETPNANSNTNNANSNAPIGEIESLKLKISNIGDEVAITSSADGKRETVVLNSEVPDRMIEADDKIRLSYYKGAAEFIKLELNGRKIESPLPPANYRRVGLDYEINLENAKKILQDGKITIGDPVAAANSNTANTNAVTPNAQ